MCYLVRVELERQLPVCALDLLIGGARRNAEDLKRVEWPNLPRAATVSVRETRCTRVGSAPLRLRSECAREAQQQRARAARGRRCLPARTRVSACPAAHPARAPHAPNVNMPLAPADERPLRCFTACAPRGAAFSVWKTNARRDSGVPGQRPRVPTATPCRSNASRQPA